MLRLRYAMFADFAAQGERGKRTVVGIFDTIAHSGESPVTVPRCFLVASIAGSALDGTQSQLELRVVNDAGDSVLESPVRLPVLFTAHGPDRPTRAEIAIELVGLKLPGLGDYQFQFWGPDGVFIGDLELNIVAPPGTPPAGGG